MVIDQCADGTILGDREDGADTILDPGQTVTLRTYPEAAVWRRLHTRHFQ